MSPESTSHRMVTGAFGTLLLVIAVFTVVTAQPERRWPAAAVALVLAILGVDAVFGAVRGRASIVSRIGPLP